MHGAVKEKKGKRTKPKKKKKRKKGKKPLQPYNMLTAYHYSIWDTYYFSYLQVVHRQSITHAGYILNSFSLMSSFISPFIGM